MRAYYRFSSMAAIAAVVLSVFILIGCGEDNAGNDADTQDGGAGTAGAPTIPPMYTIVPDFGDLTGTNATSTVSGLAWDKLVVSHTTAEDGSHLTTEACVIDNYLHASGQVGFWNLALTVTLAVPVWSFGEAFNHTPTQQEDGSWIWSYSAHIPTHTGVLHTAELHGDLEDGRVYWEMYITKEGVYEDFLWYSGESDLLATEGTWTLKKNHSDDIPWIGIEWSRTTTEGTWQVKYTNIEAGGNNEGGYIEYGINADEDFDAFYDIYYKVLDNLVEIESNRTSKAGRVKNPAHFGDDAWHNWDGNHCDDLKQ